MSTFRDHISKLGAKLEDAAEVARSIRDSATSGNPAGNAGSEGTEPDEQAPRGFAQRARAAFESATESASEIDLGKVRAVLSTAAGKTIESTLAGYRKLITTFLDGGVYFQDSDRAAILASTDQQLAGGRASPATLLDVALMLCNCRELWSQAALTLRAAPVEQLLAETSPADPALAERLRSLHRLLLALEADPDDWSAIAAFLGTPTGANHYLFNKMLGQRLAATDPAGARPCLLRAAQAQPQDRDVHSTLRDVHRALGESSAVRVEEQILAVLAPS